MFHELNKVSYWVEIHKSSESKFVIFSLLKYAFENQLHIEFFFFNIDH